MIDYQTQQYKLFPQIANAYAFLFSGTRLRNIYFSTNSEIQQGNIEMLPEVRNACCRKCLIFSLSKFLVFPCLKIPFSLILSLRQFVQ